MFVIHRSSEQKHDELYHYGVKGMKWGIRRYQNKDGSYTDAGKKRLTKDLKRNASYNKIGYGYITDKYLSYRQKKVEEMPEVKKIYNDLKDSRKELSDVLSLVRNFNNNPKLIAKYQEKSALQYCKENNITDKKNKNSMDRGI